MTTRPHAHVARAADAEILDADPGSRIALLADPEHTGSRLTANRSLLRAGHPGTPAHAHRSSAELLYVLAGRLELLIEDELTTLDAHDLVVIAPGTVHAFAAAASRDAELLVVFTPGTPRFDYYRLLDGAHRGDVPWGRIAETQERFDNHYADSPLWHDGRPARPRC